ncbi:MAG: hypothetical protein M3447_10285, partial [Acidobacteriota bacterium]|nr:hypothetical protein [Acidobacteriota bacterium]
NSQGESFFAAEVIDMRIQPGQYKRRTCKRRAFLALSFSISLNPGAAMLFAKTQPGLPQKETREVKVSESFAGKESVTPTELIGLRLSRPLEASEGTLAVFIGQTDVTSLFTSTEKGLKYSPSAMVTALVMPTLSVAESIDTGTMRNRMRSCPVGQFIVGVDLDGNRLLCSNQPVVNSSAPYTASFEIVDTSTTEQGLKRCPEGYGMTGLSVVNNKVSCAHVGKMSRVIFSGIRRSSTNACPAGRVMAGLDADSEKVLCGRRIDTCFGAAGSRCGFQSEGFDTPLALCTNNQCLINAGSWDHDECCWQFPNGKVCRSLGAAHDGKCTSEFSKALTRLAAGYNWRRNISFSTLNTSGVVDRDAFCAPAGTIVHRNDVDRCCSSSVRLLANALADPLQATRDAAKATAQGINPAEPVSGNARVCR